MYAGIRPGSQVARISRPEGPTGVVVDMTTDEDEDGRETVTSMYVAWNRAPGQLIEGDDLDDIEDVTPKRWVNVYLHDRAYGGPEEGGWWYDTWAPVIEESRPYLTAAIAEREATAKQVWCDAENAERRSDIYSVVSEGRYEVHREAYPPVPAPLRRPHYC